MDWMQLISGIVPTLVGLIGGGVGIIYWRENKALKGAEAQKAGHEAEQSKVETQKQEIDLGKTFMNESLAMLKQLKDLQKTNNTDTANIVTRMDALDSRMSEVEKKMTTNNRSMVSYNKRLGTMERYLNGNLKEFAAREEEAKKTKKAS